MCAIETTTAAQEWDNLPENSEACLEPETSDVSRRSLFSLGTIAAKKEPPKPPASLF